MSDSKPNAFLASLRAQLAQLRRVPWGPRLRAGAKKFWKGLDVGRRVAVNLLFLAIVVFVVMGIFSDDGPDFADQNALVVKPKGTLVEQVGSDPMDKLLAPVTGGGGGETLLRDLIDTVRAAKDDDRIDVLVLDLSKMSGGGLTKLQDLGLEIDAFRESGKRVIATADSYNQAAYYLASRADEVYLHPMGEVGLEGYGRYRTYYADALRRLEVDWNIFKVGTFKSAVEPFMRRDMSPEAKEANMAYLGDIWSAYVTDVAKARGIDEKAVRDYAENIHLHIEAAGGDADRAALAAGLVDKTATRDELRDRVIELVGEDEEEHTFHQVSAGAYLKEHRDDEGRKRGDAVGVIVARGTIQGGKQPPGAIGGDSLSKLIRKARHDDKIKAIVLRVDSGGGSAFASELIRRELELARAEGKPVVVSMGSVAASGGYWIATSSDEIWAHPTTLTGSIGIFGMFPTFQKPLDRIAGMRVDGVGTTPSTGMRPERPIPPHLAKAYQRGIERGYERFITLVAEARDMSTEDVDAIAQGRIWSGEDAHERGLVDKLGNLEEAVASAAALAELGDEWRTAYVEPEVSFKDKMIRKMMGATVDAVAEEAAASLGGGPYTEMLGFLHEQAEILSTLDDPHGLYAYEIIDVD